MRFILQIWLYNYVLCFLDLQTGIVSRIVSITNSSDQLGRDEIAIVTSLLENQTDIAAGNATVSEPQDMMSSLKL